MRSDAQYMVGFGPSVGEVYESVASLGLVAPKAIVPGASVGVRQAIAEKFPKQEPGLSGDTRKSHSPGDNIGVAQQALSEGSKRSSQPSTQREKIRASQSQGGDSRYSYRDPWVAFARAIASEAGENTTLTREAEDYNRAQRLAVV